MPMTVDEALQYQRGYFGAAEPALKTLSDEVKRLRAQLAHEVEESRVLKWTASLAEKEVGSDLFGRLRFAAVQHAKDQEEIAKFRALVKWFEDREPFIRAIVEDQNFGECPPNSAEDTATEKLVAFLSANPKPEST